MADRKETIVRLLMAEVQPGQCTDVDEVFLREAFPWGHDMFHRYSTQEDAFLGAMPGSAWGEWTIERAPNGDYRLCRHESKYPTRVWVEPDRR